MPKYILAAFSVVDPAAAVAAASSVCLRRVKSTVDARHVLQVHKAMVALSTGQRLMAVKVGRLGDLMRELQQVLAIGRHENVVKLEFVVQDGPHGDVKGLVYELCDCTLDDHIRRLDHKPSEAELLYSLGQVRRHVLCMQVQASII